MFRHHRRHRQCEPSFEDGSQGAWAARRGWRGHFGPGKGWGGGRHGFGGGDMMRAGRMLAQGDLRLIALALIAEQPRHGYEIIKVLEDKTAGWYSPSPGIVYPTLTYLEEAGYVTAQTEGAKKLYTITDEGRAHLEENRAFVDAVLERLSAIGERVSRMRRRFGNDDDDRRGPSVPPLVRAALENLREVAAERLAGDSDAEAKVVEVLARAASELKKA
ncbi:MAG TPA: PadR family transcriptional regulator [Xanthobacteraceae bacterium]|nr:PadR family transcriptional regulator [Xanthobacteraceae bacterium]